VHRLHLEGDGDGGLEVPGVGGTVVAERLEVLLHVPDIEDVLGRTRRERLVVGGVVGRLRMMVVSWLTSKTPRFVAVFAKTAFKAFRS